MLVLNPCHNDARVLRAARSLSDRGAQVRVFALGNSAFPHGLVTVAGVDVHRLQVRSWLHLGVGAVRAGYLALHGALIRRAGGRGRAGAAGAQRHPALRWLLAPLVPVLLLLQHPVARRRLRAAYPVARRLLRAAYPVARRALRRVLLPVHRPTTTRAFWRAASAAVVEWRPDVVHAHDLNTMPAARRAADLLGVPVIYDSHELWRHRNRHGEWRPVGRVADALMERRLAPSADAVITVSPSIARWLERTYRLRGPVHVVRNAPLRRVQEPMSGLLGRRPGEQVVVYTGRFTSGRGLEDMICALSALPESVVLVAVGYGDEDYVDSLRSLARHHGVLHRVRLLDPVAPGDVPAAIADGDLALVAIEPTCLSYRFSLPNKLFEAVQAGVPVVASDLPDIADLVTRYGLGRRFRPGDAGELAKAVCEVLADPAAARTATSRAADELCWEREVTRLLSCYRSLGFALPSHVEIDLTAVPQQARPADRVSS